MMKDGKAYKENLWWAESLFVSVEIGHNCQIIYVELSTIDDGTNLKYFGG